MNLAIAQNKDPYDANDFEIRAEKYAQKMAPKWLGALLLVVPYLPLSDTPRLGAMGKRRNENVKECIKKPR